ncbi:MAG: hypothetical protein HN891_12720, partial [Planctomycetes bacterium]|nr:hypothetical protein [Planctomycetota bacterium]
GHFQSARKSALPAYTILQSQLGISHHHTIATVQVLVNLHNDWHLQDLQAGHDRSATRWQLKLDTAEQ